jgi:hypothetical protein
MKIPNDPQLPTLHQAKDWRSYADDLNWKLTQLLRNIATQLNLVSDGKFQDMGLTRGDILYVSAPNTLSRLPIGENGAELVVSGGVPAWGEVSNKIYEPVVISGFNNNVSYIGAEPLVPDFVTTDDGDIVMAWGGEVDE